MKLAKIALTPPIAAISVFAFFALTLSTFGFDYSSTITASGYTGEETLQNFPVLVKISPTTIQGFDYSQLKHGNADIAFVSMDGGTEYPFEIDTWDTSGTSLVWVKLPELTAATQFKFLWGDESVTASAANAHAVWGSVAGGSYLGVWHMNGGDGADEVDSAGTVMDVDMTFTAMAGTGGDTSRMTSVAGMIGTGRSIDSKNATKDKGNYFLCSDFASAGMGTTFTISYWERPYVIAGWHDILDRQSTEGEGNKWRIRRLSDRLYWYYSGQSNVNKGSGYPWAIGKWTFVTLSIDDKNVRLYGNGELMQTATTGGTTPNNGPLAIANRTSGEGTSAAAEYDELRILNGIAASGDWVKAEYDTVVTAGFLAYGPAAMQTARGLTVTAVPEEIGAVSPAYGTYKTLADGSTTECTAPSAEWDITDQKHAHFTGWKYYVVDDDGLYQLADEGDTLTFSYKQEGDAAAKLEWQIAYRWTADVTVAIPDEDDGKGTVSGSGSYTVGDTVTLTAVPKDGETFYYWEGDLPEGVAPSSPTLTFTLGENGASFTPHFTGRTARWKSPVDGNWTDATKWEDGVVPDNDGTVDIVFPSCETLYAVTFKPGTTKVRGITHEYVSDVEKTTRTGPNWTWNPTAGTCYLELGAGGFTAVSDRAKPWSNDSRVVITLVASQAWKVSSDSVKDFNTDRFVHYAQMRIAEGVTWTVLGTAGYEFNSSTDQKEVKGIVRTNSKINGTAGFASAMDRIEWFNTTDAASGLPVYHKTATEITTAPLADAEFKADLDLAFDAEGGSAILQYTVSADALGAHALTNKWTGYSNLGLKFTIQTGLSYGQKYPGRQGVKLGNAASTVTFGGTNPAIPLKGGLFELVSNTALGPNNAVQANISAGHAQGFYRGLTLGDGVTQNGKVYVEGGLYAYNVVGTTEDDADVVYGGEIAAIGDAYPYLFVAGAGSTATFNGKVTAKGNENYKSNRYSHIVNGGGTVIFNGDNSAVSARFCVRGGTMGLGHGYAAGKNKEILLGDIVRTNVSVRCVRYADSKAGATVEGKYVVSNATAGQPFTFDGVTLAVGDRVLVTGGNGYDYNGVFEVTAIDKMTRISDSWFTAAELFGAGARVVVEDGENFAQSTWMMFSDKIFMYEPCAKKNPDVGVKTAGAVAIANPITVTDNKSTGRSVIGGLTADESSFTGAITLEKDVTFEAAAGGTVTIAGTVTDAEGSATPHKFFVEGLGKVVFANGTAAGRTVDFTRLSEAGLDASGVRSFTLASGLADASVVLPDAASTGRWKVFLSRDRVRASCSGLQILVW